MEHSVLRRAAAILAVCAVAVSACSLTSFADIAPGYRPDPQYADFEGASIALSKKTITMEEAQNVQTITFSGKSNNNTTVGPMGIHVDLDPGLEVVPYYEGSENTFAGDYADGISGTANLQNDSLFVATMSTREVELESEGTDLWSFKVKVKNPIPGKKYYINVVYCKGDIFNGNSERQYEMNAKADYAFTHVEQGYIQIEGDYDPSADSSEFIAEPAISEAPESSAPDSSAPESSSNAPESSSKATESSSKKSESSKAKTKTEWLLGDVNNDKTIDIEDAVLIINNINGVKPLDSNEMLRGDVDQNKTIDIEDAVAIIGHVNGVNAITGKVSPDKDETSSKATDSSKPAESSKPEESSKAEDSSKTEDSSMPDDSSKADTSDFAPELEEGEYWVTIVNDSPELKDSIDLKNIRIPENFEMFDTDKQPYSFPNRFENLNDKTIYGSGNSISFGVRDTSGEYKAGNEIRLINPRIQSSSGNEVVICAIDPYLEDDGSHHVTAHFNVNQRYIKKPELPEGGYWITIHNMTDGKYSTSKSFRYKCDDNGILSSDFTTQSSNPTWYAQAISALSGSGDCSSFGFKNAAGEYKEGNTITVYDYEDRDYTTPLFSFDPYTAANENHDIHIYFDDNAEPKYRTGDISETYAKIPELDNGKYWITVNNVAPASTGIMDLLIALRPGCVTFSSNGKENGSGGVSCAFESGDTITFGIADVEDVYQPGRIIAFNILSKTKNSGSIETDIIDTVLRFDILKFADENHRIVINYDGTNWYLQK